MSLLGFVLKSMHPEDDGIELSSGYTMVLSYRGLFFKMGFISPLFNQVS